MISLALLLIPAAGQEDNWASFGTESGLLSSDVYSVAASEDGVWAGLNGAVARFVSENSTWSNLNPPELTTRVKCIDIGEGEVWFGTFGDGVYLRESGSWSNYRKEDGLPDSRIEDLVIQDGKVFVATGGGASRITPGSPPSFKNVRETDGLPEESLTSVGVAGGVVWFGTKANGVLGLDLDDFSFRTQVTIEDGLSDSRIVSLAGDGEALWIGTGAGGLCRFHTGNGSVEVFNRSTGLVDNLVGCVAVGNRVWAGSWGAGVSALSPGGIVNTYLEEDGLIGNDIRDISTVSDSVWFATSKGLSRFEDRAVGPGGGGIPIVYGVVGVIIVVAIIVPLALRSGTGKPAEKRERKRRPYEICGGQPREDLCPFCKYNVVKGGRNYCSKYNLNIDFE